LLGHLLSLNMPKGQIINISGSTPVDDPEYRYKMPSVMGKVEGRGNGIKTVIANISDLGLSLKRPPGEVNKFFGCELGAQTSYSEDTDRAVVNGAHTDAVLQDKMHVYIETFVLCPNCRYPETEYKIKSDTIFHRCKACGAVNTVNMQHKLCTYILAQNKKAKAEKKKKDKEAAKKKKKGGSDEEKEEKKDKEKKKDKKDKDKKKDKKDKKDKDKKKKDKKDKKNKDSPEKGGGGDYIKDALESKEADIIDGMDDLSVDSVAGVDDAGAMGLAVAATKRFMEQNPGASPNEISEVVVNEQMASALKSFDKINIFIQAAITPNFFKNKEMKKYSPVMKHITNSNPIMERHLIGALESFCMEKPKNFAVMIKQLYDEDALEEDVILEWAGEGRSIYTLDSVDEEVRAILRAEAEPVVAWLQEEDESDESDNEWEGSSLCLCDF